MKETFEGPAPRRGIALLLAAGFLLAAPVPAAEAAEFRYDEETVDTATYFAAISNLANAVMFSGLGEPLVVSPYERDDWLRRAGYVTRPPMPEMGIVGHVYAAALPVFAESPDFSKPQTLRWDPRSFDRRLDPGAQAWTLLKIASPEFHLQYHELPENKLAGLMMIPQARAQAQLLQQRLRDADGRFATRSPDGRLLEAEPRDQAAVLWAASSLILASTSRRDDYWHKAYRDLVDADDFRPLADLALAAVEKLPPRTAADRAIAVEALGRYALATADRARRRQALGLARAHADGLRAQAGTTLEDLALAVYGLTEAGRLFRRTAYAEAAADLFRSRLMPQWDEALGVFRGPGDGASIVYTTGSVGAVVAALNAMRWHGPEDLATMARRIYSRFFEIAVVRSGLLRASPLPLVGAKYLEAEPASSFAHPMLPTPKDAGMAPVFASEVTYQDGQWRITDPMFRTEGAMFLVNMLAMRSQDRADTFLPADRLKELR